MLACRNILRTKYIHMKNDKGRICARGFLRFINATIAIDAKRMSSEFVSDKTATLEFLKMFNKRSVFYHCLRYDTKDIPEYWLRFDLNITAADFCGGIELLLWNKSELLYKDFSSLIACQTRRKISRNTCYVLIRIFRLSLYTNIYRISETQHGYQYRFAWKY